MDGIASHRPGRRWKGSWALMRYLFQDTHIPACMHKHLFARDGSGNILTADDSGVWGFLAPQLICYELRNPQKRQLTF